MRTKIFYFSATGNCMTTAKILAELLPETCEVVSVSALRQVENVMVEEDNVGFVFPVYYGDMPYIVRETIEKMTFTHDPYIFLMATYRGHPGDVAKRLEDVGVAAVMPLGSPIGSNQGIKTEAMLRIIIEQSNVPVVVDAGLGLPSHAAQAIELGADAILVNSAIAAAGNPCAMAEAFASAVAASEKAILAGPAAVLGNASASSPADLFSEVI